MIGQGYIGKVVVPISHSRTLASANNKETWNEVNGDWGE